MEKIYIVLLLALSVLLIGTSALTTSASSAFYSPPVYYIYEDLMEFEIQAIDFEEGTVNNQITFRVKYTFLSLPDIALKDVFGVGITNGTILSLSENDRFGYQELKYLNGSSCVANKPVVTDVPGGILYK